LGVFEVVFEVLCACTVRSREVDITRLHRTHDRDLLFGPSHSNVETSLTTTFIEWTEVRRYRSIFGRTVAHTEDHPITFVTLHHLEILDEELI